MGQTTSPSGKTKDKTFPVFVFLKECFEEFVRGITKNTLPWVMCCGVSAFFLIVFSFRFDALVWKLFHIAKAYPFHPFLYWPYVTIYTTSGFWLWTIGRVVARRVLVRRLSSVFQNAGLQTKTGRLPGFISDEPMDTHMRKLVLSSVGLPESEFKKARPFIESELQVFVDQIQARVEHGTVELLYAHHSIPENIQFDRDKKLMPLQFMVGATRSGPLYMSLRDVPHILVGGYTNSGKSTFLRQLLAALTLNSPGVEFSLIDLKGGLEFLIFEGLPGVHVYTNAEEAVEVLKAVEGQLEKRMSLLRVNKCSDLDAYFKIPEAKRKFPKEWSPSQSIGRRVVVIDEAAELFLASAVFGAKDAQVARRLATKIGALGRAVGIHLIVATQRPDRNAIDPLIKTNLQGRLCFQMADNASSMTILDSVRAADLPLTKGRAIWRSGFDLIEVQVPWLSREDLESILAPRRPKQEGSSSNGDAVAPEPRVVVLDEKDAIAKLDEARQQNTQSQSGLNKKSTKVLQ